MYLCSQQASIIYYVLSRICKIRIKFEGTSQGNWLKGKYINFIITLFFSPWTQLQLWLIWDPKPALSLMLLPVIVASWGSWNNTTKVDMSLLSESEEMLKIPWISSFMAARKKWSPAQINDIKFERLTVLLFILCISFLWLCHERFLGSQTVLQSLPASQRDSQDPRIYLALTKPSVVAMAPSEN